MKPEELDQLIETLIGYRAGKPWEARITPDQNATWFTPDHSLTPIRAIELRYSIRLKHWTLPPPPEGREWHKGTKFTAADLPNEYRPLLVGEEVQPGDQVREENRWRLVKTCYKVDASYNPYRTQRPLPEPEPDPVPLGPEDVPPMSIIRKKGEVQQWHWRLLSYVDGLGMTCSNRFYPWAEVMHTHEILRPGEDWQPCHKDAP